jgi:hypothetical protein
MNYTYEEIVNILKSSAAPVIVVFTKMDGTVRSMNCTLNKLLIPIDKVPKGTGSEKLKEDRTTIRVFDTDLQDWRSFKVASVTNITHQ